MNRAVIRWVTLLGLVLVPLPVAAVGVTVEELIENSSEYGDMDVTVQGELVGDYGFRGDGWMWTQLNGDLYVESPLLDGGDPAGGNIGIGVRMPVELGRGLHPPGVYGTRGPIVRLSGTWKYHATERQGDSFLQVDSVQVIEPGRKLSEEANWWTITAGVLLLVAATGVWFTRPRVARFQERLLKHD